MQPRNANKKSKNIGRAGANRMHPRRHEPAQLKSRRVQSSMSHETRIVRIAARTLRYLLRGLFMSGFGFSGITVFVVLFPVSKIVFNLQIFY